MLRNQFTWAIILIGLAVLGGAWIASSQETTGSYSGKGNQTEAPIAGYLAPDFSLPDTTGVETVLIDQRGQPVVLNFWASWCPPCRVEIPHFQNASLKYNGRAAIWGIDQGEPLPVVADFGSSMGVTYPLLVDESSAVNRLYGIAALPTTIFVGGDGVIREVYTGIVSQAVLEDRIERMLDEE